jgi:hypothetical protein
MRNLQTRLVDLLLPVEQEVEVERPRALGRDTGTVSPEGPLQLEQCIQEAPGREAVSSSAAPFRKRGWSRLPTGSVFRSVETRRTFVSGRWRSRPRAALSVPSRSPRLEPRPT